MSEVKPIKIGITGQSGFIGYHLCNEIRLYPKKYILVEFERNYFDNPQLLRNFVNNCDVIIHLAGINRHQNSEELYNINIQLANSLVNAIKKENAKPHVIFSSSTQENLDNPYGKSKLVCRKLLEDCAKEQNAPFTGLIIPNVFGPFGLPNYNSFIATFCYKLIHDEDPTVIEDREVDLIYVSSLCKKILSDIDETCKGEAPLVKEKVIQPDFTAKVSKILTSLKIFKSHYIKQGIIPTLQTSNDVDLFNTFRSYIDMNSYFPFLLKQNIDDRGEFVETIKLGTGGQVSFSTTKPGITRGNHYHTRKIERFTVIKGKAKIQLRKIGADIIYDFILDGDHPSHVDMPVWYTHNITNIGNEDLYTQFWINEWYDEENPDTYFEKV